MTTATQERDTDDELADEPAPELRPAGPEPGVHEVCVEPDAEGRRLDQVLASALPGLSRSRVQALIAQARVSLPGSVRPDAARRMRAGERIAVDVPDPVPDRPDAQHLPLAIVFEDEEVVVVDKAAGMVVHPAPGAPDGTLVNALLAHCGPSLAGIGGVRRPGIVHRIDKDTSGLVVVAKTARAHAALSEAFAARTVRRAYLAVVWGVPRPPRGSIEGAIGRHPRDRKRMAVLRQGGKPAVTDYGVQRVFAETASLVECRLRTGRTHQIRVHMTERGWPLVGDPIYGTASAARRRTGIVFGRQALHAALLGFDHPATGEALTFSSPVPPDMDGLLASLERL